MAIRWDEYDPDAEAERRAARPRRRRLWLGLLLVAAVAGLVLLVIFWPDLRTPQEKVDPFRSAAEARLARFGEIAAQITEVPPLEADERPADVPPIDFVSSDWTAGNTEMADVRELTRPGYTGSRPCQFTLSTNLINNAAALLNEGFDRGVAWGVYTEEALAHLFERLEALEYLFVVRPRHCRPTDFDSPPQYRGDVYLVRLDDGAVLGAFSVEVAQRPEAQETCAAVTDWAESSLTERGHTPSTSPEELDASCADSALFMAATDALAAELRAFLFR